MYNNSLTIVNCQILYKNGIKWFDEIIREKMKFLAFLTITSLILSSESWKKGIGKALKSTINHGKTLSTFQWKVLREFFSPILNIELPSLEYKYCYCRFLKSGEMSFENLRSYFSSTKIFGSNFLKNPAKRLNWKALAKSYKSWKSTFHFSVPFNFFFHF